MKIRIADIKQFIESRFPLLGVNKQKEFVRLVYEIAKRDRIPFRKVFDGMDIQKEEKASAFHRIKARLLEKRFPHLSEPERHQNIIFPDLKIDPAERVRLESSLKVLPQKIFVEEAVQDSPLARRFKKLFPKAKWKIIAAYGDYVRGRKFTTKDYNTRMDNFFIIKENYDFLLDCPCSPGSAGCGYHTFKLGTGCPYECVYCYFQGYVNSPGMVFPANVEDYFKQFEAYPQDIRIGTGQFTDSLAMDRWTQYSTPLIEYFKSRPQTTFEFKTKGKDVQYLLKHPAAKNIVVSWSINPQKVIRRAEYYTASLTQRLNAAKQCQEAGYRVGFHFDPIIYFQGWDKDYAKVVNTLFDMIPAARIAWISLGLLRMTPKVKQTIESRFPETDILDGDLIPGYDGKLRYPFTLRQKIFAQMRGWIRQRDKKVPLYLCMEDKDMCQACGIFPEWVDG